MASIFIESKPVADIEYVYHLYLVYVDDDGNEFVIGGHPSGFPNFGAIDVEVGLPMDESKDNRGDDTKEDRGSREINLGDKKAEDVWHIMLQYAQNIHNSSVNYDVMGPNSNSSINSILSAVGIDILENIPLEKEKNDFPGIDTKLNVSGTLIGTDNDDTIHGDIRNLIQAPGTSVPLT